MSHAKRYQDAIAALARPLAPEDGEPAESIEAAEARLGIRLPAALRDYYLVAGRFDPLNQAHNRLFPPGDWFVDAGRLVFMEENQAVVFWGVVPDGDDPPVWQGVNLTDQPIEWHEEVERCSEFLVVMLHWQAVCGGLEFAGIADITQEQAGRIRAAWRFIGKSGDLEAFGGEGRAACIIGGDDSPQLYVGGRTEEDFEAIEAELEGIGVGLDQV